jgi:hypothetical protein
MRYVNNVYLLYIKKQGQNIFRLQFFFHQTTAPGLNRQVQKLFLIFSSICEVIRIRN